MRIMTIMKGLSCRRKASKKSSPFNCPEPDPTAGGGIPLRIRFLGPPDHVGWWAKSELHLPLHTHDDRHSPRRRWPAHLPPDAAELTPPAAPATLPISSPIRPL